MPKLIIDDREIEVPPGTKVIDAAEILGIMIPRFCFHPALGSVGACRVCAVKVLEGPVRPGIQMSCMIDAQDGMVVSTTDPEAVDFRKHVIEWLMLHHPHDCPVCDEGGHCLLQDMTVAGGHGLRRYAGNKRTHVDQELGPLVQHEMNRCIQCYRCSRYYQEFTGYKDLGVTGIGNRVYFGRQQDGVLESPFAGNIIDICPTGVYTDKPSRYKGRRWEFERTPGLCVHCSLGCHLTVSARYREIVRHEARFSAAVNGHFICDRGRYGFYYASLPDRPRSVRVDGQTVSLDAGMEAASKRIDGIRSQYGNAAVAILGGTRSSLETISALVHASRAAGLQPPAFFDESRVAGNVRSAVSRLRPDLAVSMREIESADCVLAVGCDPLNEAPMLALAIRQASRRGAAVLVIDPRPVALMLDAAHVPVSPNRIPMVLATLLNDACGADAIETLGESKASAIKSTTDADIPNRELLSYFADALKRCNRPVVICGTEAVSEIVPNVAADVAQVLAASNKNAGLFYVLPGANAFAAGLVDGGAEGSTASLLDGIESGKVKALLVVESDPLSHFPDEKRPRAALDKLDVLVVADYVNSPTANAAHVFIPTMTIYESGGTFINSESRVQRIAPAFKGGEPILQTGKGDHPPRVFGKEIPGGAIPSAQTVVERISGISDAPMPIGLPNGDDSLQAGIRVDAGSANIVAKDADAAWNTEPPSIDGFELILSERTFGTEPLSVYSPCLAEKTEPPFILINSEDAETLSIADGEMVSIHTESGTFTVAVRHSGTMAKGTLMVPKLAALNWRIFDGCLTTLKKDQLRITI